MPGAALQIALVVCVACLNLSIPRRPDVFRNGNQVDRENTASFLKWVSFSWAETLLKISKKSPLQMSDLPELSYSLRTECGVGACRQMSENNNAGARGVWIMILRSQSRHLICQAVVAVALSVLSFVPQFSLMQILAGLEDRQKGEGDEIRLWKFVILLGLSSVVVAILEMIKYWISYNKLTVGVQELLTVAIFDKAVRLNAGRTSNEDESPGSDSVQNPVNTAAIDAKNVADFLCWCFQLYETPLKLTIASVFLFKLLGLNGLFACVVVVSIMGFANSFTATKYNESQDRLMGDRDHKLAMITEILRGIQHVKFCALEDRWEKRIHVLREDEMRSLWSTYLWQMLMFTLCFLGPIVLSATSLTVYAVANGKLSPTTAFTTVAVLNSIEMSLSLLPDVMAMFGSASVSIQRISTFFAAPDHSSSVVSSNSVEFQDAAIAWPGSATDQQDANLKGLTLQFPPNSLSIISGPTGAGKSLLLAAILGECDILAGSVHAPAPVRLGEQVSSGIAYVPQVPWIERGTIKNNILFGAHFNASRYSKVLFACALGKDLEQLPQGDSTEIGTNGANLSGGQKWRVCLARALYSSAHTLILDDILSAVDVHTRVHLYRHALIGEMAQDRTRILVTHHIDLCLPQAKYLVRLREGSAEGMFVDGVPGHEIRELSTIEVGDADGLPDFNQQIDHIELPTIADDKAREEMAWEVCKSYVSRGGRSSDWILMIVSFLGYSVLMLGRAAWVQFWTNQTSNPESIPGDSTGSHHGLLYYLSIYLGLSAVACIIGTLRCYLIVRISYRASQKLFNQMLHTILRAPLQWHSTTPFGRILNRFSSDLSVLDSRLTADLRSTLDLATEVAMSMVAGVFVNPQIMLVAAALVALYLHYARQYLKAARQLKRFESSAKSPILGQFDSSIAGLSVIRAFGRVEEYREFFRDKVDCHARAMWHLLLLNRWLAFRNSMIGAVFSASSTALIVSLGNVDAAAAGFAITFTMQMSTIMGLAIGYYASLENDMNSVERIVDYSRVEKENYKGLKAPAAWPTEGRLEVSDLVVHHAPHLPPVLQQVNFSIPGSMRVGVVGRTGAGKSSLVQALFRILEADQGQISVDGIDISQIRLQDLRSRIAVIPQSPVIFRGSIRSNLDPFNDYQERELVHALDSVGWLPELEFAEAGTPSPLERTVTEGGNNLSSGQRQLLCIAREIVHKPKILVLDEATSAVDKSTDQLIQQSVRSAFRRGETTLVVIAHRLSTVADFDRILVLDAGQVAEFGSPQELLGRENGMFREMVEQDSEKKTLKEIIKSG
ncbi:hypothetical protein NUU61_004672 [Penicillium alfredii]|uniref:P-loop containing nucleoside triphosphate hydrolase protein n=1 Tax=Penicillium alfredii TaxID=1506179 RepID=A0A9W9F810_9EURO|nr:uncharacterized protein NUU61_004672 [Penicillium alfredii]KAJ5095316.1 hypothetical protein NUU61_004672 [Penicillium alfredii]